VTASRRARRAMLSALLAAAALGGCATAPPPLADLVLARVNGEPITVQELQDSFTTSHQGHGVLLAGKGAVREFLDKAIDRRLLAQEARRIGLDQDPAVVKAREDLAARRAADMLQEVELGPPPAIQPDRVLAAWELLRQRLLVREILVDTRAEAEAARARVIGGEDFSLVARQVSLADNAARGGDLGIVRWGQLDRPLDDALWSLAKGEVSQPIETEEGWYLLDLVERAAVELPKFDEVKGQVTARLVQRERTVKTGALLKRLLARHHAVISEGVLVDALRAPAGAEPAPATTVVATAGEDTVTLADILPRVDREAARRLPAARLRRQVHAVLEAQLYGRLLRREGLARGYAERPAVVHELDALTESISIDRLLETAVFARLEVGEPEADAYYRGHPREFTEPEAIRLRAILVESEEETAAVLADLKAGKDFGLLARRLSKDPAGVASGGEVGWVERGRLDPEVEKVAFELAVGEVGIAKGRAGYFVLRLEERRPERLRSFAEVKAMAGQQALRQHARETLAVWTARLREQATIRVDDATIERAVAGYEAEARHRSHTP
jgi:peptidyl-prolyl cis-trans isomerase C